MELTPLQQWAVAQLVYEDVLCELDKEFTHLQIPYMPIKGAYLIATGLGERLYERRMADIDILIPPVHFEKALSYFRAHPRTSILPGSWPKNPKGWAFEFSFTYRYQRNDIVIDIHKSLNYPERFAYKTQDIFSRAHANGVLCKIPSREDALLVTICHRLVHIGMGVPDDFFRETKLLTQQSDFSWSRFWDIASDSGIMPFVYYIFRLCQKRYPLSPHYPRSFIYPELLMRVPHIPLCSKYRDIIRRIFLELPFSHKPARLVIKKILRLL